MPDKTFDQLDKKKQLELFKQRFAIIMKDMGNNVKGDGQMLWLIGSLAANLIEKAEVPNWAVLKSALSPEAHAGLVNSIKDQGNALAAKGNAKAAYAAEILGLSVVCFTLHDDPHMAKGDEMLDRMIDDTVKFYHHQLASNPALQVQ